MSALLLQVNIQHALLGFCRIKGFNQCLFSFSSIPYFAPELSVGIFFFQTGRSAHCLPAKQAKSEGVYSLFFTNKSRDASHQTTALTVR